MKKIRIKYRRPWLLILWLRLNGLKPTRNAVYTFGSTVYAPGPLTDDLITHERRHVEQQAGIVGPLRWWFRYGRDKEFRLAQEAQAYGDAFAYVRDRTPRRRAMSYLFGIADLLASEMYGSVCTQEQARERIQDWCRDEARAAEAVRSGQIR